MSFEGTGKYFLLLFLFYFIVYIIVKICLSNIFKRAREKGWKAFIPIYNKLVLCEILDLKKSVFYKTLIPFVNLYYFYVIISRMLEVFEFDKKGAILFLIFPMYKFPELIFKNPNYKLHMYDETEKFIHNEKSLFEKEEDVVPDIDIVSQNIQNSNQTTTSINQDDMIINPTGYNQFNQSNSQALYQNSDSVFTNETLEPDDRKETYIEAKKEEEKKEVNPILSTAGRPKVCPKCGTKLEATAKVCFFCGTQVS